MPQPGRREKKQAKWCSSNLNLRGGRVFATPHRLDHRYGSTTTRTRKSPFSTRHSPGWTASNMTG